jgi:hypothetical protein
MGLVLVSLVGFTVPDNSRFLICIVLALTASIGSGFLGGSAVASGQISVPRLLNTPVKFGVTGGIAVFIITLILCHVLYGPSPSPQACLQLPTIINVDSSVRSDVGIMAITIQPVPLSSQCSLYVEVATDEQFVQSARPPFLIADSSARLALISLPRSKEKKFWLRFVLKDSQGQVANTGRAWPFTISW